MSKPPSEAEAQALRASYQRILSRMAALAERCGRRPEDIQLLAVSKGQPAWKIRVLHSCGQQDFGENYLQELAAKASELADLGLRWHFIGAVQTNKAVRIAELAGTVHGVASAKQARYLNRAAAGAGRPPLRVFIAVNGDDEDQKQGVAWTDLPALRDYVQAQCPHLVLCGVMAVPPASYTDDAWGEQTPPLYQRLAEAAQTCGEGQLSLGMSSDLATAIRAGSTWVRIGTALLGPRSPTSGD